MRSCIATLLSIFATLTSALGILTANDLPTHDPRSLQAPVGTCLARYTNYYESAYQTVFFKHRDEPHFSLVILTEFLQFYPHTLEAWLAQKGFNVSNASDPTDDDLCGWREYGSVEVKGRRHGQIGWKRNNLQPNAVAFSTTSSVKVSRPYISHDAPIKPSLETFNDIKAVLQDNTPHADIYYNRCIMLQFGLGMLGGCFAYYIVLSFAVSRQRKKELKASKGSDDIELDQIKAQSLSGSGMERMSMDDRTTGPKFDIEITRPTAAKSSPLSTSSNLSEPPPMYTFDGAGRSAVRVRDIV
jgi:hypothetical protein